MNQIRDWDGKCQKCMKETDKHTMSLWDVALICIECSQREVEAKDKNNTIRKRDEAGSKKS